MTVPRRARPQTGDVTIQTDDYEGPCRRRSTDEERAQWRQEHPEEWAGAAGEDGRPWHAAIPKALLVFLLSVAVGAMTWATQRWVDRVELRIEAIPALQRQVADLAMEFREVRRDQLEEQLWRARRNQDQEAIRYFETRLRRLDAEAKARD
jgi:hypothetical protein